MFPSNPGLMLIKVGNKKYFDGKFDEKVHIVIEYI